MLRVPFIDLSRFTREIRAEVLEDWALSLDHSEFVDGPPARRLEAKLSEMLRAEHVVVCGSGSAALSIALAARGIQRGDRVALPNCTFWATYEAVVHAGAEPVLIDIDPSDLQMSFDGLCRAHEAFGLRAAILVHAFGWASARVSEFRAFCRKQGIFLLEDGAQAFGVELGSVPIFQEADVSTLSFYPAKVIGGSQDGGAMLTNDEALARKLRALANHGRRSHYSYDAAGWNSRLGSQNAYFLLRVLAHSDRILAARRQTVQFYRAALGAVAGVTVHGPQTGARENGYLSVVTLDRPSQPVIERLAELGIASRRTWPETIDDQAPASSSLRIDSLSHSAHFCSHVLNLPVFYGMTDEEREAVVHAVSTALS